MSYLQKLDINFDCDLTKEYRFKYESQCDCAYCINYYKTFKEKYTKISKFLEQFGLDIEFPLEIMPLEYDKQYNKIRYISYYPIKGTMSKDKLILNLEGIEVRILRGSDLNNPCPNPKMKEPYLLVEISGIRLPWILDEEIE